MLGIMIDKLRNLGPRSQEMLAAAGIMTERQLRALGSGAAFLAVKRAGCTPSLNLLWAIEGALTNRDWKDLPSAKAAAEKAMSIPKCGEFFGLIDQDQMQFMHFTKVA